MGGRNRHATATTRPARVVHGQAPGVRLPKAAVHAAFSAQFPSCAHVLQAEVSAHLQRALDLVPLRSGGVKCWAGCHAASGV